jgi:hypothetical protein
LSRANKSSRPRSTTKRKADLQGQVNWWELYWPCNVYLLHLQNTVGSIYPVNLAVVELIFSDVFCSCGDGPYFCRMGTFFSSCICCVVIYTALEQRWWLNYGKIVYASEEGIQTLAWWVWNCLMESVCLVHEYETV